MNERDLIQKWMTWKEENEQKQYSQKTLAESAGISPTYLSSMSTVLERGALALVDPEHSRHSLGGGIGVVAHRGVFLVRRVYAVGESLVLVPENPDWFPEVIPAPDAQVFSIALFIPEEIGRL